MGFHYRQTTTYTDSRFSERRLGPITARRDEQSAAADSRVKKCNSTKIKKQKIKNHPLGLSLNQPASQPALPEHGHRALLRFQSEASAHEEYEIEVTGDCMIV